jgi:hypothetical protein
LHYYFRDSAHFDGYRSLIGTYDFDSSTGAPTPPLNDPDIAYADVISYDENQYNNGGVFNANHVAFVVRSNSHSRWCYPALYTNDNYKGDLVSEHGAGGTSPYRRQEVLWSKKDVYLYSGSPDYDPGHRTDWKIAAWSLGTGLD